MGIMKRKCNAACAEERKKIKKPIKEVARLMPKEFTDEFFVETFKELYPNLWYSLERLHKYWIAKHQRFGEPFDFVLDASKHCIMMLRNNPDRQILTSEQVKIQKNEIKAKSLHKLEQYRQKVKDNLYYVQEIEPTYAKAFISEYKKSNDLHERLEIIRELSKYKSERIIAFFYDVNEYTRNFHLKIESMQYIQGLGLPFYLRKKKKGKKSFIDNEKVYNASNPEVLLKRIRVDRLERLKQFDMFISHNSQNEEKVVLLYKILNKHGFVAYVDWVNDKFDLKREWCNTTTAEVIKERIQQSHFFIIYATAEIINSQWCAWETGYAEALGKQICIYLDEIDIKELPQFYQIYPTIELIPEPCIIKDKKQIDIFEWVEEK